MLLDGQVIDMETLDQKLSAADKTTTTVWYYREAATKEAPPHAMAVIQTIVKHKLKISISSKPDFSDYVDAKGVSHPRQAPQAQIPDVNQNADIEKVFGTVRAVANGESGQRGLVILLPDRQYLVLPPMPDSPELKKIAAGLAQFIPADVRRNIAVIAPTSLAATGTPDVAQVGKAIPFLGLLMGLSQIGHAVWVFEGHPSALAAGCREADVLLIDSAVRPLLPEGWQDTARSALRNANILLHDRATFQLRVIAKIGSRTDRLEFAPQPLIM